MSENKNKKSKKDRTQAKKNINPDAPDLVIAKSDDLREVVTETVTKLLAEDVLEMDDDGVIDIKKKKKEK